MYLVSSVKVCVSVSVKSATTVAIFDEEFYKKKTNKGKKKQIGGIRMKRKRKKKKNTFNVRTFFSPKGDMRSTEKQ